MIFISHNYKDKPIVEQFAVRLSETYGQENVFYDSWSIQPGEGIIDKMNAGLERCKFFFFFISKNSLESKMVTMEWQNAIMLSARSDVKLIPVRLDGSIIPVILTQTLFLDLFTDGLEVTLTQASNVIEKKNTYVNEKTEFSNLVAHTALIDNTLTINIKAKYYMEPKSLFLVALSNEQDEAEVIAPFHGITTNGFLENCLQSPTIKSNGWIIGISDPTIPNFPFQINIIKTSNKELTLIGIYHAVSETEWKSIPLE
ncbi:toll/interleukin-1 receptor domain-containing protein [Enterococcus sp. BWB1-3]|uniref:toll/interleukin-1 receptor domain-containing protein n=1 Tax=Enterococcus sp. BWB1-3 TaxID=2787713 RepID=UPI001923B044|nr:toll/interleukin-1 receptor domain-containing protein [Enterococcus sp. BWB1-3]MBL1230325.1 toll/interleukin-1 receptor domain-containing protein [Enterococcus sp. BWB1-3]